MFDILVLNKLIQEIQCYAVDYVTLMHLYLGNKSINGFRNIKD